MAEQQQYGILDILKIVFGRSDRQVERMKGTVQQVQDPYSGNLENLENGLAQSYYGSLDLTYDRLSKYKDYDRMDSDSTELQTGLDIYGEEASQPDNKKGLRVWAESQDDNITNTLMTMFQRIKIEQKSYGIYRNLGKYGDCFNFLLLGIYGVHDTQYVHPSRIERVQEDGLLGFKAPQIAALMKMDSKVQLFKPYDFLHMRIMAYDRESVYGRSMVESLRKAWKQMDMLEKMVILYRISKATQRNIFQIDVGQASLQETMLLAQEYAKFLKNKQQFIDPKTGDFKTDFNPAILTQDIIWPVRSGSTSKVERLQNDSNIGPLADLEMWRNKIRTGLNIPKDFFDGEMTGAWNSREALLLQDVRFSKKITKLQDAFREGMIKLCQIHYAILNRQYLGPEMFQLLVGSVSDSAERMREDILLRKAQVMEILSNIAIIMGWNRRVWADYLLDEVYPLPQELRKKLLTPDPVDQERLDKEIELNQAGGQINRHEKAKKTNRATAQEISKGFRNFGYAESVSVGGLDITQDLTEEFKDALEDKGKLKKFMDVVESNLVLNFKQQLVNQQKSMCISEEEVSRLISSDIVVNSSSNYQSLNESSWKQFRTGDE